jgi:predicted RNase H-like HicB family nuclease
MRTTEGPMKLKVLIHTADEGGYWAEIPALPGCVSQGETFDETLTNIREAAEGWLEVKGDGLSEDDLQWRQLQI